MCVWIGQRQQWDEFLDFYLCKRDGVLGPQKKKKKMFWSVVCLKEITKAQTEERWFGLLIYF